MGHVQLLHLLQTADFRWQRPLQTVEAHIKHRQLLQQPNLRRQAPSQIVIHQNQLIQCLAHLPDTSRNTTAEVVVSQNQNGNRRVSQIFRDPKLKPIIIQKQSIQCFIKYLRRNAAFELIEPEVQEFQRRQREDNLGETSDESIVAQIELKQKLQFLEARRDDAAEPVGVDVEEGKISEQAELLRQVPGDVGVVEVNARHHRDGGVRGRRSTEHSAVGADVGAGPVGSEIERIGENGLFPCLQGNVGLTEARVFKC